MADSLSFPRFFPESVIDFHINVGFSGEGASQVGERISSFQWLAIHNDVWLMIHLSRCRQVHDLCLLGADGKSKTKVVASSRKVIHALLHFHFSVAVESTVIHNLSVATFTFVFALSHLRLNTPPGFICPVPELDVIVIVDNYSSNSHGRSFLRL